MTNKMKLLTGLLVFGAIIIGVGTWFIFNPLQQETEVKTVTIDIPEGNPVLAEDLLYTMRGEHDFLYIYEDGSVLYIEETGLRIPMPGYPAIRTWKTGKLQPEELNELLEFIESSDFVELEDNYQFTGEPIGGGGFAMSDGIFTFYVSYGELQKKVTALGYLTPDNDATYPDMPYPLNELYVRLKAVIDRTVEVAQEEIH